MSKVYRLFCCRVKEAWIAAAALCTVVLLAGNAHALPAGGQVTAGQAAISQTATQTQIDQSSLHAIINWNSFGIAAGEAVNISQPSSQATLLNRVTGGSPSEIFGSLTANGQVFLINPSGVLFAPGSSVSVGGLAASSLNIKDDDFMAGSYRFFKDGQADSVVNRGDIRAGFAALLGPTVENSGSIITTKGSTALGAADNIILNFDTNGLIALKLDQGAYGAQVTNSGVIEADDGRVLLTAKSADDIMKSMVNNSGTIRARTLENRNGEILLLGDMENGTANVAGTLDASAPNGGNGGFVETSAAHVKVADSANVTRLAPQGKNGTWLIDPTDFTISSGSAAQTSSGIGASTLQDALGSGSVAIATSAAGAEAGDINVDAAVSWNANKLTLTAANNIKINAPLTGTGTAQLALEYGQGASAAGNTATYSVNAPVSLPAGPSFSTKLGSDGATVNYTVINTLGAAGSVTSADLQGMNGNLAGNYALGADIIATLTSGWNTGEGFLPVGDLSNKFTGRFEGLGHTISNLTINVADTDYVGLFGYTSGATISNVGLVGANVTATKGGYVGALVGMNDHASTISNSYANTTSFVTGGVYVGGLVGGNDHGSTVSDSYSEADVTGTAGGGPFLAEATEGIGGLVGINDNGSRIEYSQASGTVVGENTTGGLVGINDHTSTISDSYFLTSSVTGRDKVGGLVGMNDNVSTISNSHVIDSSAKGVVYVGGLVGANDHGSTITASSATGIGTVTGVDGAGAFSAETAEGIGGLVGINDNGSHINSSNASVNVKGYSSSSLLHGKSIGGLVGINGHNSKISNDYATGSVTGADKVGGLVGFNYSGGDVSNAYATGAVSGVGYVGGLVGRNFGGTVAKTYSTGKVTGTTNVGGLAGDGGDAISNSFWDIQTSFQNTTPHAAGATGLNTAGLKTLSIFSDSNWVDTGGTGTFWRIYDGHSNPLLIWFMPQLTVTPVGATKIYDGTPNAIGTDIIYTQYGTDSLIRPVSDDLLGSPSISNPSNSKNVGTQVIIASGLYSTKQSGYNIIYAPGTLEITPAPLTITAAPDNRVYDGTTASAVAVGYVGLKAGDSLTGLTQTYDNKDVGATKTLTVTGYTLEDGNGGNNYLVDATTTANGTITPAALTVNGASAQSKVYDGNTVAVIGSTSLTGIVPNDEVTLSGGGTFSDTVAGDNKAVTAALILVGAQADNYSLTQPVALTANITRAPLTVTANDAAMTDNGKAFSGGNGVSYIGLVSGESAAVLGGAIAYGGTSQGALTAGTYTIKPSGQTAANYAIGYNDGKLTILHIDGQVPLLPPSPKPDVPVLASVLEVSSGGINGPLLANGKLEIEEQAPAPLAAAPPVPDVSDKQQEVLSVSDEVHAAAPLAAAVPVAVAEPQIEAAVAPVVEQNKQEMVLSAKVVSQQSGFESVYFNYKKADLTPAARKVLAKCADAIKEGRPDLKIRIEGNCDEVGSQEFNMALGELRATAALKYLVTMGVPENIFTVVSYGKERPVALEHNEAARAKNRRVDLIVVSP